jgi:hypothetical protein
MMQQMPATRQQDNNSLCKYSSRLRHFTWETKIEYNSLG